MPQTDPTQAAEHVPGLGHLARLLGLLASLFLFAMMLLVFTDVMGRYLFASPLPAAYELVSLTMPAIIFCALPLTVLREGHVTVDLLDALIPRGARRVQGVLVSLISAGALGLVTWRLWVRSGDQALYEEVSDELYLELWPFSAGMAMLCAVATLAAVLNAGLWAGLWTGRRADGQKDLQ
ncbi:MAG: TRAP transporter small permease [Pseudomonadota bacterium]